jgi:hypothetical protein
MSKLIENISRFTILFLGVISVVLVALIYFGGNAESLSVGEDSLTVPKFTDALLYWCYFLLVLAIGITLLLTLFGFMRNLIASPKDGLKSVIVLVVFVILFAVAWFLGSPEKISIIGYEGAENEGFWAQFTDMIIYVSYVLFIGIAITIAGSGIYSKLK